MLGASAPFFAQITARWITEPSRTIAKYSFGIYLTHFFCIWLTFTLAFDERVGNDVLFPKVQRYHPDNQPGPENARKSPPRTPELVCDYTRQKTENREQEAGASSSSKCKQGKAEECQQQPDGANPPDQLIRIEQKLEECLKRKRRVPRKST